MVGWRRLAAAFWGMAALVAGLGIGGPSRAAGLTIATESYPPFNMQAADGSVTGLSTDILRLLMERAGVAYGLTLMPWQRAYAMARDLAGTCVYSTTRTAEREPLFLWVGPLVRNDWVLFGRTGGEAGPSPRVATLEDARPYSIGGYDGDAVALYLAEQGFSVATAPYDRLNPKKLAAGRIDFWATGDLLGRTLAAREGVTEIAPLLTFRRTEMYLACNPAVPKATVDRLNAVLEEMRADGTVARVEDAYR
jgi:polar amino acid transport system substrate-binding protein